MRRSAEIAAKYGISRGQRDVQGLTRKDRIFRVVCDAKAAGVQVTPELLRKLLPVEARTISTSTFDRYVEIAIGGEANVPEGRNWPKASRGYRGDASAHARRFADLRSNAREPRLNHSVRSTTKTKVKRQSDPQVRQQIETPAIKMTKEHFIDQGYEVASVEKDNAGWDLEAVRGKIKLRLEVKGLSGPEVCVELTPNEYAKMQEYPDSFRLCVVTSALTKPKLTVFAFSHDIQDWADQDDGLQLVVEESVGARCHCEHD